MKKLSKKQKLIGFIAILIVAVIIAIVITTSIVKNNNQVANEGYAATNANAGSNLIANYILNGITIGGITGKMDVLNTNDATAEAKDIAAGKTAYVKGKKITGTRGEASITESYVGCYADIDGDGSADGIIYADLAIGGSGNWMEVLYTIPVESNFKSYFIKQEEYNNDFGTKPMISVLDENDGNDRFYIMALDDFDKNTHSWYYYAMGHLDKTYFAPEDDFAKQDEEPTGKLNTERMIKMWNESKYGGHNNNDIWKIIQDKDEDGKSKIEKGWFVPSKSEWAAFAGQLNITTKNYSNYELSSRYWSSSYATAQDANGANFARGFYGS